MATRLCGYPVVYDPSGQVVAVVARTNSGPEYHFATSTQGFCRRLGQGPFGSRLDRRVSPSRLGRRYHPDSGPDYQHGTPQWGENRSFLTES